MDYIHKDVEAVRSLQEKEYKCTELQEAGTDTRPAGYGGFYVFFSQ